MAYCSNCGKKISDDAKFCDGCGAKVIKEEKSLQENNTTKRKTVYDGEIHKCPNCGEIMKSFVAECPSCGYEFRSHDSNNSIVTLVKKLEEIKATDSKSKGDILKKKTELIKAFPIPNTKEEVWEFLLLAYSNIDIDSYADDEKTSEKMFSDAWLAKFEHAYEKARILFNDAEFNKADEMHKKINKKIKKSKGKKALPIILGICGMLLPIFIGLGGLIFENIPSGGTTENPNTISVGYYTDDLIGKQYTEVVAIFQDKGFTNITTIAIEDLVTGWLTKDGEVESITIAGDDYFSKKDRFSPDARVVITYHTFPSKE